MNSVGIHTYGVALVLLSRPIEVPQEVEQYFDPITGLPRANLAPRRVATPTRKLVAAMPVAEPGSHQLRYP